MGKRKIEDLLYALVEWQVCRDAMNSCYNATESSPGYYCQRQSEAEHDAREKFGMVLSDFIDDRIEERTASNGGLPL